MIATAPAVAVADRHVSAIAPEVAVVHRHANAIADALPTHLWSATAQVWRQEDCCLCYRFQALHHESDFGLPKTSEVAYSRRLTGDVQNKAELHHQENHTA